MNQSFDFSTEQGSTFESLPEDWYNVTFSKTELTTSSSGNDMIKSTLKVVDGNYKNRTVFDNLVWLSNSMWKIKKVLDAVKSPLAQGKATISDIANELEGKTLKVYLVPDTTNTGNPTNKIKNYAPTVADATDGDLYK